MLPRAGRCGEVWRPAEPVAGEQEATPLPAPSHLDASAIWVQVPLTPGWAVPGAGAFLPSAVSIAPAAALHPALLLLRDVEAVAKRHRNVSIWPSRKKRGKKKKRETEKERDKGGRGGGGEEGGGERPAPIARLGSSLGRGCGSRSPNLVATGARAAAQGPPPHRPGPAAVGIRAPAHPLAGVSTPGEPRHRWRDRGACGEGGWPGWRCPSFPPQ